MLLCLYIDSFFKKLTFITMFLLTVLVLGAKNLQKLPNRYRHLRLSFATYNSAWSKVSDVSEPLRNTWFLSFWPSLKNLKNVSILIFRIVLKLHMNLAVVANILIIQRNKKSSRFCKCWKNSQLAMPNYSFKKQQ